MNGSDTPTIISVMPPAIAEFTKRFPQAVVKVSENFFQPVENDIAEGLLDFWIGPLDAANVSSKFAVEELFHNDRRVVARKGHPLAGARNLKDLENATWVRSVLSTRSTEGDFDAMFKAAGLPPPKIAIHSATPLATVLVVANTDFLTILSGHWLRFSPLSGLFQSFDHIEPLAAAPICLVRRHGLPLTPLAEHLFDLMRKAAHNYSLRIASA